MKAVHFGAGNIGRGFIGDLLYDSGFSTTFIEVNADIVERMNKQNSYDIYIIDKNYARKTIYNVCALSPIAQEKEVIEAIVEADMITTSVWADNLPKIAGTLAKGLKERLARGGTKVNVLACENALYASNILKQTLIDCPVEINETELDQIGCFPNTSVDRLALQAVRNGISVPEIDSAFELVIEKNKLVNPAEEPIRGADYVENFTMYLERKLYIVNCGHAAIGYLAFIYGIKQCRML